MENTSYIALARQNALWRQLDVIAGNMANANTPAYKNEQMMFREYMMNTRSTDKSTGGKLSFVQDNGLMRDTREGSFTETGNPLDLALHGDTYFQVETEAGMRYTRNGHFRVDESGMLTTTTGSAVMDASDNPIILAPGETQITVTSDGMVTTENGTVAKLKVVRFANEQDMKKIGDSLYETTQDPQTVDRPAVVQGVVEESNVQPVVEITRMTEVLRQYQALQNMIEQENQRISKMIQTYVPSSSS